MIMEILNAAVLILGLVATAGAVAWAGARLIRRDEANRRGRRDAGRTGKPGRDQ